MTLNKYPTANDKTHRDRASWLSKQLVVMTLSAVFVSVFLQAESYESHDALRPVRGLYIQSVEGSASALKECVQQLEELAGKEPENPLISAYLGSALLLESSKTFLPWKKGKLARTGMDRLDAAVARDPKQIEVRFLRAASTYHLPAFIGRREQCAADLQWLSPRIPEAVRAGQLDRALGAAALYYHGLLRETAGDFDGARAAWKEAAKLSPQTHAGLEAAKRATQLGS